MINYRNKHYNKVSMAYILRSGLPKGREKTTRNTTPTANDKQLCLDMWNKGISFPLRINTKHNK